MDGAGPARVAISLLGGFSAEVAGQPVPEQWRLRKAKTLVKMLALAPGHQLHRDVLVAELWPEAGQAAATNNLHQALHAVRKAMGAEHLVVRDDLVQLCPDGDLVVDVGLFEAAAAEALRTSDVAQLRSALELHAGQLLPEDEYAEWLAGARERVEEARIALSLVLAERLLEEQAAPEALLLVERLALERPVDERVHRVLVEALAAAGRRWDAIAAYERPRDAVDEAYAAEPEPATRALYRRLLSGATAPSSAAVRGNLPQATSSFVGRRRQLSELDTLLPRARLLTLSGPGGAGKSRLALEVGHRAATTGQYEDGVWLVELAGVKEEELVGAAVASALHLALGGQETSALAVAGQLAARQLLLLLDNCEHVLTEARALVDALLERCPGVTVLATSREPLGCEAELVYRVPSLEVPTLEPCDAAELGGTEAVQLFAERARQVAPGFELTEVSLPAVVQVCHRLDGMPLALELAAARLAHLSVPDLAARLDDALALLVRRGGARLDRQQTLAATLDWSHALLDPDEQSAFRRLAVFAGDFGLPAAEAVCGSEAVDLLSRLVDKSLLEVDTSAGETRYRLLEVVRQYADARLDASPDADDARSRHRTWYVEQAAMHDPDRGVPVVGDPPAWFDVEQDNLRAALAGALADAPMDALQLATSTWRFWMSRGLIAEGDRWLALALAASPERSALRARARTAQAVLHVRQGRFEELAPAGDEVVSLLTEHGDPTELAHGLQVRMMLSLMRGVLDEVDEMTAEVRRAAEPYPEVAASVAHLAGLVALNHGDNEGARARYDESLEQLALVSPAAAPRFIAATLAWVVDERSDLPLVIGEETLLPGRWLGAQQAQAFVTVGNAMLERTAERLDAAFALLDEAHARFLHVADPWGQAYCEAQRGHTLRWAKDLDEADRHLAVAEQLRRDLRDTRGLALAISGRAVVSSSAGRAEEARTRGREALLMMERTGDAAGMSLTSGNLAVVEQLVGDPEEVLRWLGRLVNSVLVPGSQRCLGWAHLLRAQLLRQLDRSEASGIAAAESLATFERLKEQRGLAALQRARKEGRI